MKNKIKTIFRVLAITAGCLVFASFSPSLDGRAVVVDNGVFPQGLFAKTVGYLPGDIISVTNIAGDKTIDLLVIGALDPSEGVAIMLSPEAADAMGIDKGANNIVKITKRSGQDERVYGNAVISKSAAEADDFDDESFENISAEENTEAFDESAKTAPVAADEESLETVEPEVQDEAEEDFADETEAFDEEENEEAFDEEAADEAEEAEESEETEEEEAVDEEIEPPAEDADSEEEGFEEEEFSEENPEALEEQAEEEAFADEEPDALPVAENNQPVAEEAEEEEAEEETEAFDEEAYAEDEIPAVAPEKEEISEENEDIPAEEGFDEEAIDEEALDELPSEEVAEETEEETPEETPAEEAFEADELEADEYAAIVLVPVDSNPPESDSDSDEVEDVIAENDMDAIEEESTLNSVTNNISEVISNETVTNNTVKSAAETSYDKYIVPSLKDLEKGKYYIQIAAYGSDENILEVINKYGNNYPITLVPMAGGKTKQVLIGPVTMDEYKVVLERFKSYGFKDAFLRKVR